MRKKVVHFTGHEALQAFVKSDQEIDAALTDLSFRLSYSNSTISSYRSDLRLFARHLADKRGEILSAANKGDLLDYLVLRHEAASAATMNRFLAAAKNFYQWAVTEGLSSENPAQYVSGGKKPQRPPFRVRASDLDAMLEAPDTSTPLGIRDRAMLEVMYASGLRASEISNLQTTGIAIKTKRLQVVGKGGIERLVPCHETALIWLDRYMQYVRPMLLNGAASNFVFVSNAGNRTDASGQISRMTVWNIVKKYAQAVGIRDLSPHGLRHAFATDLLKGGVDLRALQLMLGHACISTTQIYTHPDAKYLAKLIHDHHPRGR